MFYGYICDTNVKIMNIKSLPTIIVAKTFMYKGISFFCSNQKQFFEHNLYGIYAASDTLR